MPPHWKLRIAPRRAMAQVHGRRNPGGHAAFHAEMGRGIPSAEYAGKIVGGDASGYAAVEWASRPFWHRSHGRDAHATSKTAPHLRSRVRDDEFRAGDPRYAPPDLSGGDRPRGPAGLARRPSCAAENKIDDHIIEHNLIGFDIDPVAIDLARRSLEIKIGKPIGEGKHRLEVRDALFDRRIGGGFDVVVTNPPYLSARNLDPAVVRRLKSRYPAGWCDLYACFMLRALELLRPGGRAGILSMQSFMFTAAFERMRRQLGEQAQVQAVAHFGPGFSTSAIPARSRPPQLCFNANPRGIVRAFSIVWSMPRRNARGTGEGHSIDGLLRVDGR